MPLFHVSRLRGLKHCAWIALAFILARACMNGLTKKKLQDYRKKRGLQTAVDKLQEEIWLVVCGTALSLFSGYLIATSPAFDGCNMFDTTQCYTSFRSENVPNEIKGYYLIEVGWYLSLIMKSFFGVGRFDSFVMEFHHVVTLALIIWSYSTGFTQIGVVTFFIFNQSNPLLHLSKLTNYMEWKSIRAYMFILFAATFFLSRVVLLPLVVIRSTFFELPRAVSREDWEGAVVYTWYTTNACLGALWLLNVYWLKPILRVIKRNITGMDKGNPTDDTITREDAKTK